MQLGPGAAAPGPAACRRTLMTSSSQNAGGLAADPGYLRQTQYRDPTNLEARIALHDRFSTNPLPFSRWLFDQLELPPDARILEVGCGSGLLWRINADRVPPDWRPVLTDLSPGMITSARAGLRALPGCRFAVADAMSLPFADGRFDAVLANHMLYHVPDRAAACAEFHRVLKPGGTLYAATNGSAHLREIRQWVTTFGIETLFGHERSPRNFGLHNGAQQLAPWFEGIRTERHADSLAVTAVEAVMGHIRSTLAEPERYRSELSALEQYLAAELESHGALRISKSTGAFIGTRADHPAPLR